MYLASVQYLILGLLYTSILTVRPKLDDSKRGLTVDETLIRDQPTFRNSK